MLACSRSSDLLEELYLQARVNGPAVLSLSCRSHTEITSCYVTRWQLSLSWFFLVFSVNLLLFTPPCRWRTHLWLLQTVIYSLPCIFFLFLSFLLFCRKSQNNKGHMFGYSAFIKPFWLNTYSLAATHKVWPVFMSKVRIEVYAVWNSLCFSRHEAISVLKATEQLQASKSPWVR